MTSAQPAPKITVVLADDHTLFREGLRQMLATDPEISVIGEAADGESAARLAFEHHPDILLLDVEMPGPGAAAVIQRVNRDSPGVHVIVLTMHDDSDIVQDMLDSGAAAYLVKSVLRNELIAAIHSIAARPGAVLLSVSRHSIEFLENGRQDKPKDRLTKREAEILKLTAEAFSNAQIASKLFITESTVKRHLTNIYAKLNAVSRVDAIRKASEARLIRPADSAP